MKLMLEEVTINRFLFNLNIIIKCFQWKTKIIFNLFRRTTSVRSHNKSHATSPTYIRRKMLRNLLWMDLDLKLSFNYGRLSLIFVPWLCTLNNYVWIHRTYITGLPIRKKLSYLPKDWWKIKGVSHTIFIKEEKSNIGFDVTS